jgi:hypothetical protein
LQRTIIAQVFSSARSSPRHKSSPGNQLFTHFFDLGHRALAG